LAAELRDLGGKGVCRLLAGAVGEGDVAAAFGEKPDDRRPDPPEPPATNATPGLLEKSGTVTASQSEGLGDDDLHDLAGPA